MASSLSFDIVSEFDRQELVNALDQVRREVATRYDFKGSKVEIDLGEKDVTVVTDSEMRSAAVQGLASSFRSEKSRSQRGWFPSCGVRVSLFFLIGDIILLRVVL